jgi:hypothetical protein
MTFKGVFYIPPPEYFRRLRRFAGGRGQPDDLDSMISCHMKALGVDHDDAAQMVGRGMRLEKERARLAIEQEHGHE